MELHDSEQRVTETTTLFNRAIAERKKFEADALQYQGEVIEIRQELKIIDERVNSNRFLSRKQKKKNIVSFCFVVDRIFRHEN